VIRTGFLTIKGGLVRDILYPRPSKFKFYQDSLIFIGSMAALAILGFIGTIPFMLKYNLSVEQIIVRSLDLLTVTVPPALPAAMTVGTVYSLSRLKRN